jgi:nucleoside-triphosphatase
MSRESGARPAHVFLTGEIRVGKSTALRKFLAETGLTADGFASRIVDVPGGRELYIARFDSVRGETDDRLAARIAFPRIEVFGEVFDAFGADILSEAGRRALVLMDELGVMEENSPRFKAAVFRTLDGAKPVVGVVRRKASPFLDAVRARADVELITVTAKNRDAVPALLAARFAGRPAAEAAGLAR